MPYRKKLIEVALPLEAINAAAAREKSIRHGHPSTLHLWWARRPLAAARAVIFAQMVDDPSGYVDELLADPAARRAAERAYKTRLKAWQERSAVYAKARAAGMNGASNPEPGPQPTLEETAAAIERQRLFHLLEQLVLWENTTHEAVLEPARAEIRNSWRRTCRDNAGHPRAAELFDPDRLPAFHDPFAGGGALPLEAQRLGLEAYASDLNPVAVLINKAMIEIPPKFAGQPPVNPRTRQGEDFWSREWHGAQGLAEDVRYYGQWMRDQAEKRIGHLYPQVEVTAEMARQRPDLKPYVGHQLTVVAWLWARTVKSPNPAFAHVDVPLVSNFMLSTKAGKEAYVEPVVAEDGYRFTVRMGQPTDVEIAKNGTKISRGSFRCLLSGTPIPYEYIDNEANSNRMGARLMAVVAEGDHRRIFLSPNAEMERISNQAQPSWKPDTPSRGTWASNAQGRRYGFQTFGDYFTKRQLVALTTFSDLVQEARAQAQRDALAAGLPNDGVSLAQGGRGAAAYGEALATYLGFGSSRAADAWSSIVTWRNQVEASRNTFSRQAIPMTWDFTEVNPFSNSCGHWLGNSVEWVQESLLNLPSLSQQGYVEQANAAHQIISSEKIISTDPPYYDNIGYADLSDFFYVWLRRSLRQTFPELFITISVPKVEELVATPYRHGSKEKAESFFLNGMTEAMRNLSDMSTPVYPVTIYYAFKQAENENEGGVSSTGWETFLEAVIRAGFALTGTWPMKTEKPGRTIGNNSNALASSIVLVCRQRPADAPVATRREFVSALQGELPAALAHLQAGNIAPVDLAQAAIGPGMAVYTRYSQVLDAQGHPLSVRQALALINQTLDEV
ncbi:MAG: DUF1156 domain-containing protein, partial [Anaerolineaceae bacterium]|nr:DUF1156 domain-containing protein [Anaerolineaceae bacterium]